MSSKHVGWDWGDVFYGIAALLVSLFVLGIMALSFWVAVHFIVKYW